MDLLSIVQSINSFFWGYLLVFLLCGTGIFFTIRLKFVQVRKFKEAFKHTFGGLTLNGAKAGKDGMSSFQSLATAIAAQVGTGNLAGAATAIVMGGPGAIFWMWLSAFFGMSTIFAEATLAQKYKTVKDGEVTGGPSYYIKGAFKGNLGKILAGSFSIFIIVALGFMGNMVQSNSIGVAFENALGINPIIVGVLVALLASFIFLGGRQRIASTTEKLVPIMAAFYIIGAIIILVMNGSHIIPAFKAIFIGAFSPEAVTGGLVGITIKQAIRYGVSRGLFSNEAGMGSTPHAHAIAKVNHPFEQGVVAMMGVFIDTFIILTLTALVILTSGAYDGTTTGIVLTQNAFVAAFGSFGNIFIAICLLFFAFSTIIGWYFFGETNIKYLFGEKATKFYAGIVLILIVVGSSLKVDLVWELADTFNGFMVIPNLLALLALNGVVCKLLKDYEKKKEDGLL
ncbi:alanine/glycine:cation symporter family protein [Clostridium fallax]|uniref:Alanine or glycine:cation symporter, AGCS family n=1 Tax=Clostridium fallax TaxID=1533 RepID=A0A1M4W9D6_9CLOT|nr:sodium:alanine symporter family protein [Clostridium fallax]SHE77846.1 alanine or glycine:cation symporter, AGCS family [Clostridium fallax]SQB05941.1 sodium:alanine symporter family protein [Clostridium fallax]